MAGSSLLPDHEFDMADIKTKQLKTRDVTLPLWAAAWQKDVTGHRNW